MNTRNAEKLNSVNYVQKDEIRRNKDSLTSLLASIGVQSKNWTAIKCPFHNDNRPSASVRSSAKTGAWYFYCYVCGIADDYFALRARIESRPVGEIIKEIAAPSPTYSYNGKSGDQLPTAYSSPEECVESIRRKYPFGVIEEVNPYTNPETNKPDLLEVRYRPAVGEKKKFAQFTPSSAGWLPRGIHAPNKLPFFNRIRILKADTIIFVEGVKCVRALTKYLPDNIAATTLPGGASTDPARGDWGPLKGKKVYVWPDNDEPGQNYAKAVANQCLQVAKMTALLIVEQQPKEDAADYIAKLEQAGATGNEIQSQLVRLINESSLTHSPSQCVQERIKKIHSGDYVAVPFTNFRLLSGATRALLPGTITMLISEPGVGKSWFLLQQCWEMINNGVDARIFMLEEDKAFYLQRALAQMAGRAELTDPEYIHLNGVQVNAFYEKHRQQLDVLARHLTAYGSRQLTYNDVEDWCHEQAARGARVLIIDPITAAFTSQQPWLADQAFILKTKEVAEKYGLSIILSTHPRIGALGKPSLSGLAGGSAFSRFSQTVLWMQKHQSPVKVIYCDIRGINHTEEIIRTISIKKARNGHGDGISIAIKLNLNTLRMEELGAIREKKGSLD